MMTIHTAACQPAQVNIVVLDLFTLNQQKNLKEKLTLVKKIIVNKLSELIKKAAALTLRYLFCFFVVAKSCFSLSIVEVECIIIIEVTLQIEMYNYAKIHKKV